MEQYFKVAAMACAVLAPFVVLSTLALVDRDSSVRRDIERTIGGTVDACLAAIERETGRHVAVLEAFAGTKISLD